MEKWVRGLSRKEASAIGGLIFLIGSIITGILYVNLSGGILQTIIWGAALGLTAGLAYPLIYKGKSGYTPMEKRELARRESSSPAAGQIKQ